METPFNSDWFVKTWLKHFKNSIAPIQFDFIDGVQFYKKNKLPIYINIGKNLTKGFNYTINPDKIKHSNRVLLIYDIPSYYNLPSKKGYNKLKIKSIPQYNGYYTSLDKYHDLDDFIKQNYSASRRKMLRRRYNGLIKSFDIKTQMYFGDITVETYNMLFDKLYELLDKRFKEKRTDYHILSKWEYIKELSYPMILNKELALFVLYDGEEPIGIRLCFQHQNKLIGAIPIYNTDFAKFGLGNILTFKLIEWCLENNIEVFDSSKGDYGIKKQISDTVYSYDYHVLYNPKSLISYSLAFGLIYTFQLKQYLRNKNLHTFYHKIKYKLKGKSTKKTDKTSKYQIIEDVFDIKKEEGITHIDYKERRYSYLNKIICDFLYASGERKKDLKTYKKKDSNIFFLVGKLKQQKVMAMPYSE